MPKTAARSARKLLLSGETPADVMTGPTSSASAAGASRPGRKARRAEAAGDDTPSAIPTTRTEKGRSAKAQRSAPKTQQKDAPRPAQARVPINAIVEQWQRERPDLDPAPMRLFGALAQAHLLTTPYINRVLKPYGLVRGTFDVLSALRRAGPPFSLTPKQLAESLLLSGAGMTNRLDRLEALHLIARLPEPNDRRSLKIQLTHKGVKLVDEMIPQFVEAQWHLVASLGTSESEMLIDLLRRLADALLADLDPSDLD